MKTQEISSQKIKIILKQIHSKIKVTEQKLQIYKEIRIKAKLIKNQIKQEGNQ
jgi:predicted DNA-binding protein YlxM (UPF0122 family)